MTGEEINNDNIEKGNSDDILSTDKYCEEPFSLSIASQPSLGGEDDQTFILQHVVDDFSLQSKGIGIRFRNNKEIKIYEQALGQLILEETVDDSNNNDRK